MSALAHKLEPLFLTLLLLVSAAGLACGPDSDDDDDNDNDDAADGDDDDDDARGDDEDAVEGLAVDGDNGDWTDAGIRMAYGDTLTVDAAGEVSLDEKGESVGPDGAGEDCGLGCPEPSLPRGALIGRLASGSKSAVPFLVGSHLVKTSFEAGDLQLIVNDDDYSDNGGRFVVEASVDPAQPGDDDDDDIPGIPASCQPKNFAAQVVAIEYGTYAGFGQDQLPDNVLGPPRGKGDFAPQASPFELVSLGEGGRITLKMGRKIVDGDGPDFAVFENVLYWSGNTSNAYTEAAVVDVSQDGVTWERFDFDFLIDGPVGPRGDPGTVVENFIGFAGIEPAYGNCDPDGDGDFSDMIDPLDPSISGGDLFDLADIGLDWAAYVRIVDTGHAERNPGSEMTDGDGDLISDGGNLLPPFQGIQGFDLDAVAVIHGGDTLDPDPLD